MRKKTLACIFLFLIAALSVGYSDSFEHDLNHSSDEKIHKIQICGERCTGTNFIEALIVKNFQDISSPSEFGWKHFLWWFGFPVNEDLQKNFVYSFYESDPYELTNSEDCLFVIVVRNPYDWLRSFYSARWHVHKSLYKRGFSHFIKSTWKAADDIDIPNLEHVDAVIDGTNPITGKPFSNVLELRKMKNLNYIKISGIVANSVLAKYETVRDDPQGFVDYLAANYNMTKMKKFTPITAARAGKLGAYKLKKYRPISDEDLAFINKGIDWDFEAIFGYQPKDKVR